MITEVVTVCSHMPHQPYYHYTEFLKSLVVHNVGPTVLGFEEGWGGLITKPKRLRHYLRHVCKADVVIACDCFDVIFLDHPDAIAEKWASLWPDKPIVFNAERNLFPRSDLAEFFPETGTPFRYLNSGFMIGRPNDLLDMIESIDWDALGEDRRIEAPETIYYNGHIPYTGSTAKTYQPGEYYTPNDQSEYQEIWTVKPVPMELDTKAELCLCAHGSEVDDFEWGDRIRHRLTDTEPGVIHCNGGAKESILPRIISHLGLA